MGGKNEKITVLPVENLAEDFIMGADVSSMISVEKAGGVFYDSKGKKQDLLNLLKSGGVNCVRVRVWNEPFDKNGNGYGGGNCTVETAVEIGKRAAAAGLDVLIDFHYSDFWADPNKQSAPKAWKDFSLDQKKSAVSSFTLESLQALKNAGVNVKMVQVGNEINNGICGEIYDDAVCALVKAGCDAVRSFDSGIQIAVHYTDPLSDGYLEKKASMLEKYKVDYDIFATSYYPFWHGDVDKLSVVLKKLSNIYGKKVMVAETSYPFTDEDGDGFGNVVSSMSSNQEFRYPISVEGQAVAVRDVIAAVASVKKGVGVFYWEPAWIPVKKYDPAAPGAADVLAENARSWEKFGCGWASSFAAEYDREVGSGMNGGTWDNQALFDFDGKALESLNVFKYARTGSRGKLGIIRIESPSVEFAFGKQGALPGTVSVLYNNGEVKNESVEWDEKSASAVMQNPSFGEYEVSGRLKNGTPVLCTVRVTASNFLVNGSFETSDLTGWTVENKIGAGEPKVDRNSQNARDGLCYFTAWDSSGYEFDISQKVENLSCGKYKCFASFEGTGVKNPSGTVFKVSISGRDGSVREFSADVQIPNVWKKFFRAELPEFEFTAEDESITVSAHIKAEFDAAGGANGAWIVMDDVNLLLVE
ncbi:glycosyl hydrolase 53 family protein [Treponema sp.]|uniref:glycosyl hydrolase 53 family protein n=1 Tax=Treponema sp. TaxID=166 RepID=UPI003F06D5B4